MNFINWFHGKKTYFVALAMIAYAVLGSCLGKLDQQATATLIFNALGMAGLRHGISGVSSDESSKQ